MELHDDQDFRRFIQVESERFSFLRGYLQERGLDPATVELAGSRHLLVGPARRVQPPHTILMAHYDRVGVGANDNSAAVFMLAEVARQLRRDRNESWLAIFTDREEAAASGGVHAQGSFGLARGLQSIGLDLARVFIIDACGRGDCLVVSTTADRLLENAANDHSISFKRSCRLLRLAVLEAARNIPKLRTALLPTPFSDDAGFLAAGLPAQTLTMLPSAELDRLIQEMRSNADLAYSLVGGDMAVDRNKLPETWRLMNGDRDTLETLDRSGASRKALIAVLCELCQK